MWLLLATDCRKLRDINGRGQHPRQLYRICVTYTDSTLFIWTQQQNWCNATFANVGFTCTVPTTWTMLELSYTSKQVMALNKVNKAFRLHLQLFFQAHLKDPRPHRTTWEDREFHSNQSGSKEQEALARWDWCECKQGFFGATITPLPPQISMIGCFIGCFSECISLLLRASSLTCPKTVGVLVLPGNG